jgi:hypothetical protein
MAQKEDTKIVAGKSRSPFSVAAADTIQPVVAAAA